MAKIPDFSELTKKLDLQGIMDSVKSAIGTPSAPAKAPEGDEIAAKFVEAITQLQQLTTVHAEQAKTISELNTKLNALYKDVMAYKGAGVEKPAAEEAHHAAKKAKGTSEDKK